MAALDSRASQEIWLLPLTDDGAPEVSSGYIYLPPPTDPAYILRFKIEGTSSICRQGSLWVNIPAPGEPFQRDQYRRHECVPECPKSKLQLTRRAIQALSGFQWDAQD